MMKYKISFTEKDFPEFSEDKRKKAEKEKSEEKKKLEEELENIRGTSVDTVDDVIKKEYDLEYLKKNEQSDKDIEDEVKLSGEREKRKHLDALTEQYEGAVSDKKQDIIDEEVAAEVDKQHIENAYKGAKAKASDDALRRGIARSSIIVNLLKDYDLSEIEKKESRAKESEKRISSMEKEIDGLGKKLDKAVKNLDMETAFVINEEILRLKKERDEENENVTKYNNEVKDKIAKYRNEFLNTPRGKEIAEKSENMQIENNRKMVNLILNYYDSLPYEEVAEDFDNSDYSKYLNENGLKLVKNYVLKRGFEKK